MRLFTGKKLAALALTAGIVVGGNGFAQETAALDPQVRALIERLEAAEQQIQSLTSELNKVKEVQSQPKPFPGLSKAPAAIPVSESMLPLDVEGIFGEDQQGMVASEHLSGSLSGAQPLSTPQMTQSFGREQLAAFEDAVSKADQFEERLGLLEGGWKELDEAWADFNAAEKKKKADAAKKPTFKIGGRIHADYWDFVNSSQGINNFEHPDMMNDNFGTPPEDRAAFRRIRLEMGGDILETMLWRMQIDFAEPDSPNMKDVYLGFKELPFNQQLLIGNQKRPLGLDHLNSSRYNVFVERPFVIEAFNEDARRPGIAMYGYTDDESLHWRYGAYFLENVAGDGNYKGQSSQMSLNARLSGSPWYDESSGGRGYFHWAVAGMAARPDGDVQDSDSNSNEARFRTRAGARSDQRWLNTGRIAGAETYEILGLETIVNHGAFQFVSEYQHNWVQREGDDSVQFHGAYAYVSYFLTGEHIPYDRKSGTIGRVKPFENFFLVDNAAGGVSTGWGAWNIAARYDYLDLSDDNVLGGVGQAWTGVLNWWWTPYSRLQFTTSYGDIRDHEPVDGLDSGNYFLFGTRFAVDF